MLLASSKEVYDKSIAVGDFTERGNLFIGPIGFVILKDVQVAGKLSKSPICLMELL